MTPRLRAPSTLLGPLLGALVFVALAFAANAAMAQEATGAAKIARLNKQALDAFDGLNFDQAKSLLEQALVEADAAGLTADEPVARTHLNLGMLLIAGFQQKEAAIDHFKSALRAKPDITAPPGLFNPEVQQVFDEVKASMKAELEAPKPVPAARPAPPAATEGGSTGEGAESEDEEEGDDEASTFFLSLGLGSGAGYASGHLDANKDIFKTEDQSKVDNSWSGAAPSSLGHLVLSAGYFISPSLVLSLEGRFQIITGTTPTPTTPQCVPSCKPPTTAFAGLLKGTWFLGSDKVRPFVSGGIGGGSIRQVVKVAGARDCDGGGKQCVDTVTGGPLLLAAGGGVAYQLGTVALLGGVTANVGVPNFLLNVDLTLGLGLRL